MLGMDIVYNKQRRRCPKHKRSKITHHYASGCTRSNTRCSSFQLWLYQHKATSKILFLHSLLFSRRFLPLATHLAITLPDALIRLFAKRHTRNYNFKQWPEVNINLIPVSGPPGCRHLAMKRRKNSFGGNGRTCHFEDSPNKDCLGEAHFWKGTERGRKNVSFIVFALLKRLQNFLRSLVLV